MKKHPYIILLLFLILSCNKLPELNEGNVAINKDNQHLITKGQALNNLKKVLISFSAQEVKSGNEVNYYNIMKELTLDSVKTVNRIRYNVKSSEQVSQQQELLYYINFKEDGYAILSADDRIPDEVIAISENGNTSNEDFEGFLLMTDEQRKNEVGEDFKFYNEIEDSYYCGTSFEDNMIYQVVYDYACNAIDNGPIAPIEKKNFGSWIIKEGVEQLLSTTWKQGSPFNDWCPYRRKFILFGPQQRAPAGCVPVAIAQIMAYHEYPNYSYNDVSIDWKALKNINPESPEKADISVKTMAAALLKSIGDHCLVYYAYGGSFGLPSQARDYLRKIGYKNVYKHEGKSMDEIYTMLKNRKPVFIAGLAQNLLKGGGHAWVIDGYRNMERNVIISGNDGSILRTEVESKYYLHCNFGWGGAGNGYYTAGLFNSDEHFIKDYPDKKAGYYNYSWCFRVITYDL